VVVALLACRNKPRKATPEDTARIQRVCQKHADYDPKRGGEAVAALDTHLAGRSTEWRDAMEQICYFSKRNYFVVYTLIDKRDTHSREQLCEALRASGGTGIVTPIYLHCSDGKRCTTCRQGAGEHR
jgi:hypothetical protein